MNRQRIAVIGGGVSGLSAAYHLMKSAPCADVHLFECGPRLGGVIKTTEQDGFLIEAAAENFITTSRTAIQLCNDLGLGDELIPTKSRECGAMVVSRGKLEPVPTGFLTMAPSRLWPLLSSRILSPMGKLRSGLEVVIPRKRSDEDEALRTFICRRFGTEMFERLVQPLAGDIHAADPTRLSVAATMPDFLNMEREHGSLIRGMLASRRRRETTSKMGGNDRYSESMTLRGGMSRLIDALGECIPWDRLHLNTPIERVQKSGSVWTIVQRDSTTHEVDAVVIAAPTHHASRMLQAVDGTIAKKLGEIEYASCAIVSLAFRRDQIKEPIQSFGFVVPQVEDRFILSCSFSSEKFSGRAPSDCVLMRVFMGGAMQPGLLRMPNEHLIDLARSEVAAFLRIEGSPLFRHLTRRHHSIPQYHVGHKKRLATINERLERHPSLALAGNAISGVGVPGCIESGKDAAHRVIQSLQRQTPNRQMQTI